METRERVSVGAANGVGETAAGYYDQCWYPVALSDEVAVGAVVRKDFLNGRVAVYRGQDGKSRVMSAYCRHVGADMAAGDVVGNDLRCAFHHWQYGGDGMCNAIPSGDSIPKNARLFAFPTAEKWGIIWAFNGEEPLYEAPDVPPHLTEENAAYRARRTDVKYPVPPWVIFSNSMDFQHLRILHEFKIETLPEDIDWNDYSIEYDVTLEAPDPALGKMDQHIKVVGTSCFILVGGPIATITAACPMPDGLTREYVVAIVPKDDGGMSGMTVEQRLDMVQGFFESVTEDDIPVLTTMRFKEDNLLPADRQFVKYLGYVRRFPKTNVASEYIT